MFGGMLGDCQGFCAHRPIRPMVWLRLGKGIWRATAQFVTVPPVTRPVLTVLLASRRLRGTYIG